MNVRTTNNERNVEALASSISSQGLLQNLVVTAGEHGHEVVAGGRRYRALALLVAQGRLPADHPVPVKIVAENASTAASTTENVQRETMHPADEYAAFQRLTAEGWSIDKIADAFGVTPLVVERRLRLSQAAPALMEEFRKDKISTEQLIALCATEDHGRQVEVWESARSVTWQCSPQALRKAIVGSQIDASNDDRVQFIGGLDAYLEAGGKVRRDLFSEAGQGGFLDDHGLLAQLVNAKLEERANALRAEGWGWVEVWSEFQHAEFSRLGKAPVSSDELPAEAQARIDELNKEREALEDEEALLSEAEEIAAEGDSDPERSKRLDAIWKQQQEITDEIECIDEESAAYAPEVMAKSGALVIYQDGEARIERGLVRTADRQAVGRAAGDKEAVRGGRETEPAGRKADELSDALRRSLLGHRNLAAQMETAKNARVAKVLLACWTVQRIRAASDYSRGTVPTDLTLGEGFSERGTRTRHPITDPEGLGKASKWAKQCAERVAKLPKAEDALWDELAAMKPVELDSVIAHGVALSVSLDSESKGLTGKLLAALGFDMATHFAPTADNYFERVSKTLILEALTEAGKVKGAGDKGQLELMKKGELAAEASRRMAGTGWVPTTIRAPKAKQPSAKGKKRK